MHAEEIAVAAAVVQNSFDPNSLLQQNGDGVQLRTVSTPGRPGTDASPGADELGYGRSGSPRR